MVEKHRLQKPTRFVGLPKKWKMSPKTDEIMGNSGTATAVPAVCRAAPLANHNRHSSHLPSIYFQCKNRTFQILHFLECCRPNELGYSNTYPKHKSSRLYNAFALSDIPRKWLSINSHQLL